MTLSCASRSALLLVCSTTTRVIHYRGRRCNNNVFTNLIANNNRHRTSTTTTTNARNNNNNNNNNNKRTQISTTDKTDLAFSAAASFSSRSCNHRRFSSNDRCCRTRSTYLCELIFVFVCFSKQTQNDIFAYSVQSDGIEMKKSNVPTSSVGSKCNQKSNTNTKNKQKQRVTKQSKHKTRIKRTQIGAPHPSIPAQTAVWRNAA
jgi:hypothetical protein